MSPMHEIAHLAHVELLTPVPEESLAFFTGYLGMTQAGSAGDSVFVRAWDDYEQATVKLTAGAASGVGRTNPRAASHVNYPGVDVAANRDFLRDTLGAMVTEQIVMDDGTTAGSWTTPVAEAP